MNLKAIRGSYGDFGRMSKGMILKDISRERAEKLIASGAYAEATAADLKAAEKPAKKASAPKPKIGDALRDDGPTVAEYVASGYSASNYPPQGYAARSTPEEVAEAVTAEKTAAEAKAKADARADLEKLTNKQLHEIATAESIAVETDDNKATLVDKIEAGRAAKA